MRRNFHLLTAILFIFLLVACSEKKKQKPISPKANQVVLIFDKMPVNTRYKWEKGHTSGRSPSHEISYIDDHSIIRYLTPEYAPRKDTIVLTTKRDFIEVQHTYKGLDYLSYRFQNGDSVLFTYNGRKPFAEILNRNVSEEEVNHDIKMREELSNDYFPGILRTHRSFALTKEFDSIPWETKAEVAKQVGINAALKEYTAEGDVLDSLSHNKIISKNAFDFYTTNREMDMAHAQFDTDFGFGLSSVDGINEVLQPEHLLEINLDSVSTRFYYHKVLEEKRRSFFTSKVDLIRVSNGSYWDSRQAYDLIRTSDAISKREKDLMLIKTIGEIYRNFNLEVRLEYWEKFQEDVKDSVYLNLVKERYEFGEPVKDEVELVAFSGEKLTLSEALEEHRGKVVYLDFWASWCAPCIETIPDAKKLQEEFDGREITFMYISIDEEAEKWMAASKEHSLHGETPGYIVTNKKRSRNLDYLDVRSIPRYMIYDKEGKMVEGDAPRPGTQEIKQLLETYL